MTGSWLAESEPSAGTSQVPFQHDGIENLQQVQIKRAWIASRRRRF
jgi:hypothetical protein